MQRSDYHKLIRTHLSSSYLLTEEKIESVLPRFLESLQGLIHNLDNIARTETDEAVSRAGHAVKGALLNLGLNDLAEKALAIEKNSLTDGANGNRMQCIAELKNEIAKII